MQLSNLPARIRTAFATSGAKNTIPQTAATPGAAAYDVGFPALTMLPLLAGGIPPAGQDFNGILNAITAIQQWQSGGGSFIYDAAWSTANGGYPKGATLLQSDGGGFWLNTVDNNTADPESGTATGWVPALQYGVTAITGLTNANVTLTAVQAAKDRITLAGTLTGNVQIILPPWLKNWTVINNTTGAFSVTVKTAAGAGAVLPAAGIQQFYGDGTNLIPLRVPDLGTLVTTSAALTAGQIGLVLVDATAGNLTITLPPGTTPGASSNGFNIFRIDTGSNTVSVIPSGTDLFQPGALNAAAVASNPCRVGGGETLVLRSNGRANWYGKYINGHTYVAFPGGGSGNWLCPPFITRVGAKLWGAGASGGACSVAAGAGGGGGGGGYRRVGAANTVPGISYPYTVGQGGAATTGSASGNSGGNTTIFGVTALGGAPGIGSGGGGNGGGAGGSGSGGDFGVGGTSGGSGYPVGSVWAGGIGGGSFGGASITSPNVGAAGIGGAFPGGGGNGGAGANNSGVGGNGLIELEY